MEDLTSGLCYCVHICCLFNMPTMGITFVSICKEGILHIICIDFAKLNRCHTAVIAFIFCHCSVFLCMKLILYKNFVLIEVLDNFGWSNSFSVRMVLNSDNNLIIISNFIVIIIIRISLWAISYDKLVPNGILNNSVWSNSFSFKLVCVRFFTFKFNSCSVILSIYLIF